MVVPISGLALAAAAAASGAPFSSSSSSSFRHCPSLEKRNEMDACQDTKIPNQFTLRDWRARAPAAAAEPKNEKET
jgi:hypothetical protein